ncbi:MAG: MFS transporter [Actinobacteria bacterium]|nr:MFS transporter [Actinomycetota bacterium]MBV8958895.1 MFS transporter [Actinomycetota bacterium]MBV9255027.1 MFS transporter [Actinomycetota bacterium]MBV9665352.1 MFS transporter [Actinomycetota bacterium]MBV9933182.1 MFS transporter [Actinomycetota bacterium]
MDVRERQHGDIDACCALGAAGGDEVVVVPWPQLLRHRVQHRLQQRVEEKVAGSERYRWVVLFAVMAGLFSINVTFTVFAVALPRIAHDFHTDVNTITWVITAPLLAFGVTAPALGRAGDLWGHKRVYVIAMAAAVFTAVLSAVAWNAPMLILARTLDGIEGAATGAAAMALIFRAFPPEDRVKAMGWWSLVGAGGPVIGVVIGGVVIEHFGWRWIFVAQVPLTLTCFVLCSIVLPGTERVEHGGLDWKGALTLMVAATGVLFGLNRGPEWGWSSPGVITAFALSPIALVLFVMAERRAVEPLLPLEYLRKRNFSFPIATQALANFAYMGGFILAPLLLAQLYGYKEGDIGLIVIARPLTFSLTAPLAGYLAVRVGERAAAVSGTVFVFASMLMFASVGRNTSLALVIGALALSGLGLGASSPSIASSVGNAVPDEMLGVASAAQQVTTQVGVSMGIQLMATIQAARSSAGLVTSFRDAYLVGAAVCVIAVVCALFIRDYARTSEGPGVAATHLVA